MDLTSSRTRPRVRCTININDDTFQVRVTLNDFNSHIHADAALAVSLVGNQADPVIIAVDPDETTVKLSRDAVSLAKVPRPGRTGG